MTKIYVTGNYLIVDDGIQLANAHAKDVVVVPHQYKGGTYYSFINFPGISSGNRFHLSELTTEAGVAYTKESFETFYRAETGKAA